MFKPDVYARRRRLLKKQVGRGIVVFVGNEECPMNYPANTYPFRQDSSFLYFFGLASPGLAAVVDIDENKDILFGDDIGIEDIIWMGHLPKMRDRAREVGVRRTAPRKAFADYVRKAVAEGRPVHYLPPYRSQTAWTLSGLLGVPQGKVKAKASQELIKAVVDQRMVKSREEVREVEKALEVTHDMYLAAMKLARPGRYEREVSGAMEGIALSRGYRLAFPPIVTVNGQTLHNHEHGNVMAKGRMLVMDVGAESDMSYASDITRTVPVGGRFNRRQRDVYDIVLAAQLAAIRAMKPGVMFKDVHIKAATTIAQGLKDLGLMKGDPAEAVAQGAHAMFFPHGLGHNMGLDVHDMEDLGENNVGYNGSVRRSDQFGLAYLRMARELRPGYIMTVEPGLYFIPDLAALWKKERKHRSFIDYDKAEKFMDFGGVRIEDDVLVTDKGRRVLGPPIPKTPEDVEKACR